MHGQSQIEEQTDGRTNTCRHTGGQTDRRAQIRQAIRRTDTGRQTTNGRSQTDRWTDAMRHTDRQTRGHCQTETRTLSDGNIQVDADVQSWTRKSVAIYLSPSLFLQFSLTPLSSSRLETSSPSRPFLIFNLYP